MDSVVRPQPYIGGTTAKLFKERKGLWWDVMADCEAKVVVPGQGEFAALGHSDKKFIKGVLKGIKHGKNERWCVMPPPGTILRADNMARVEKQFIEYSTEFLDAVREGKLPKKYFARFVTFSDSPLYRKYSKGEGLDVASGIAKRKRRFSVRGVVGMGAAPLHLMVSDKADKTDKRGKRKSIGGYPGTEGSEEPQIVDIRQFLMAKGMASADGSVEPRETEEQVEETAAEESEADGEFETESSSSSPPEPVISIRLSGIVDESADEDGPGWQPAADEERLGPQVQGARRGSLNDSMEKLRKAQRSSSAPSEEMQKRLLGSHESWVRKTSITAEVDDTDMIRELVLELEADAEHGEDQEAATVKRERSHDSTALEIEHASLEDVTQPRLLTRSSKAGLLPVEEMDKEPVSPSLPAIDEAFEQDLRRYEEALSRTDEDLSAASSLPSLTPAALSVERPSPTSVSAADASLGVPQRQRLQSFEQPPQGEVEQQEHRHHQQQEERYPPQQQQQQQPRQQRADERSSLLPTSQRKAAQSRESGCCLVM